MKVFVLSLVTAFLLAAAVTVNALFLCSRLDGLYAAAEALPETDADREAVEEVYSIWDGIVDVCALTTGYELINRTDDAAEELLSAAISGDTDGYILARRRLLDGVRRLRRLSGFTVGGIF